MLLFLTSSPIIIDRCLLLTTERCVIIYRAAQGATAPSISQFQPVLQTLSCLHRRIVHQTTYYSADCVIEDV